jgi:hypothetical protein
MLLIFLKWKIRKAKKLLKAHLKSNGYSSEVGVLGVPDIDPKHLSFMIFTETEREKDELITSMELKNRLGEILDDVSCPAESVAGVNTAASEKGPDQCKTPFRTLNSMLLFGVRRQGRSVAPPPSGNSVQLSYMFFHVKIEHRERRTIIS